MYRARGAVNTLAPGGRLVVEMTSHAGWVGGVTALAEELGLAAGMPPARAEGVAAATREACLNAIEHGNGGGTTQPVLVRFEPSTEGLTVTVEDVKAAASVWILGAPPLLVSR